MPSAKITNTTPYTTYNMRVQARNAIGTGPISGIVSAQFNSGWATIIDVTNSLNLDGCVTENLAPADATENTDVLGTYNYTDSNDVDWHVAVFTDTTPDSQDITFEAGLVEVMVVGGGGSTYSHKAAGGGGGVRWGGFFVEDETVPITIGVGGTSQGAGSGTWMGEVLKIGGGGPGVETNSRYNGIGGGGSPGGHNHADPAQAHAGGGAGGTLYGVNSVSGVPLNYTGLSYEYGKGGQNGVPATLFGQAGVGGRGGIVVARVQV